MKTLLKAAVIGLAALTMSCSKKEEEEKKNVFIITSISDEDLSQIEEKFKPLVTHLEKELGVDVEFSISPSYPASVERFKNGEVHMVWYGGLTGVQARKAVPGARAIVQGDVDPEYKSYFIANKSTGLQKSDSFPSEIKDLTFTFGSRTSTSGRLMPSYFIEKESGTTVDKFFSKPVQFQKGHDATARAVASGSVQVGALSYKKYDSMVKSGEINPEDAPIIWETPGYEDYNLTVHPALNDMFGSDFVDKLQKVLVDCDDKEVLKAFNRDDLIPAKNEDFGNIENIAEAAGLLK